MEETEQLTNALEELLDGRKHLFITGRAGTGKSTLLSKYRKLASEPLVVVAPTGVAALNVEGQTIHSLFRFSPNISLDEVTEVAKKHPQKKLFKSLKTLVIDEVSMVRADLFDCMDRFLRLVRGKDVPFGGVRLVCFGDLYQLPPVVGREEWGSFRIAYRTPYFFGSRVMQEILADGNVNFKMIELTKIFRQTEKEFIQILNLIRENKLNDKHLEKINTRVTNQTPEKAIVLTGRRDQAKKLNDEHIAGLPGKATAFYGRSSGKFDTGHLPTDEVLSLKVGARVMMVANDREKRWVNGTLGTVRALHPQMVEVTLDDGSVVDVETYDWELSVMKWNELVEGLERVVMGSFSQLPLTVAAAVTIHKSQGKTFEQLVLDLAGGAFAHGQTYVALSRCKSLEGLYLTYPLTRRDIMVDPMIERFLKSLGSSFAEEGWDI